MSFIEFNPNPKGKVAEDCTVRAIARLTYQRRREQMVNGQNFMDELNKFAGNIQGDQANNEYERQMIQNEILNIRRNNNMM